MSQLSEKIPWQEYIHFYTLEATLRWFIKYQLEQQKIPEEKISEIRNYAEGERVRQLEREKEGKVPKTKYVVFLDI